MTALAPQTTLKDYNRFLLQSLEAHDEERKTLVAKFDDLANAQQPLGDLRQELIDRTAELHETQRLLNEQRLVVQEERETAARLIAENHVLMSRIEDDRSKVGALLALRKQETSMPTSDARYPVMVTIPRGGSANTSANATTPITAHAQPNQSGASAGVPHESLSLRSFVSQPSLMHVGNRRVGPAHNTSGGARGGGAASAASGSTLAAGVADTSGLGDAASPPHHVSTLVVNLGKEVETLKDLLEEQRRAYERDRAQRNVDERAREQKYVGDLKKYSSTIDAMQLQLNEAAKQHANDRHRTNQIERHLRGETEVLTVRAAEAERLLAVERARHTTDLHSALESQTVRAEHVVGSLRQRAKEKDERHVAETKRAEGALDTASKDVHRLSEAYERERRQRLRVEKHAKCEAEGHRSEINLMRQQLRTLEKRLFFMSAQQQPVNAAALAGGKRRPASATARRAQQMRAVPSSAAAAGFPRRAHADDDEDVEYAGGVFADEDGALVDEEGIRYVDVDYRDSEVSGTAPAA